MAESITITIHPPPDSDGNLTVEDAMRQVLDVIELVDSADASVGDGVRVVWRLARASTNSPFSVVAESSSSDPTVSVDFRAARQANRFRSGVNELLLRGARPEWMNSVALRTAKRLFDRNVNGIGRTDLVFAHPGNEIRITPPDARRGALFIERVAIDEKILVEDYTRTEYGSAEGRIVAATTFYNKPALVLREWLTGDRVRCVLSDALAAEIGHDHNLYDVWRNRRVLVGGAIHYASNGGISKIDADTLDPISEDYLDLNAIRSLPFAGGMTPAEFLNSSGADDLV